MLGCLPLPSMGYPENGPQGLVGGQEAPPTGPHGGLLCPHGLQALEGKAVTGSRSGHSKCGKGFLRSKLVKHQGEEVLEASSLLFPLLGKSTSRTEDENNEDDFKTTGCECSWWTTLYTCWFVSPHIIPGEQVCLVQAVRQTEALHSNREHASLLSRR